MILTFRRRACRSLDWNNFWLVFRLSSRTGSVLKTAKKKSLKIHIRKVLTNPLVFENLTHFVREWILNLFELQYLRIILLTVSSTALSGNADVGCFFSSSSSLSMETSSSSKKKNGFLWVRNLKIMFKKI